MRRPDFEFSVRSGLTAFKLVLSVTPTTKMEIYLTIPAFTSRNIYEEFVWIQGVILV